MPQYTLTVFKEDDTTPWFEVSTDPAHPAPYLHEPGEQDAGEVDFLQGRATISQINLRVIDPQTGASQAERWLTERLGIPAGEEGEGHTALIGRRALLMRDADVVLDGVVYSVTLAETFAGFALSLRDIRERARKTKLFERTGTASVLPRGVVAGYGRLPSGGWLVPPTTPLRCTFRRPGGVFVFLGYFDLSSLWDGVPEYDPGATVPPELVLTSAMRAATSNRGPLGHYLDVAVWWRPAAGGAWTIVERPQAGGVWPYDELLSSAPARLRDAGKRNGTAVEAIHAISVSTFLSGPWPADGESVDVLVVYIGPASREYPFHFEGTAGELLRNAYRGDYSATSPGIRYDEAAVLALTTPVRVRITEPVEDLRRWSEEKVYRALGAAPALDPQGRVSPVRAALPDPDAVLPVIDDDSAQAIPGWEHRADSAVTVVRVTYPRDYRVPAEQDPTGEHSAGDGIVSREVVIERRAPDWAIGLMGEQVHEIDGSIFRAIGGPDGEPVTGDVTDETGAQIALQRAHETLDRWVFGGQVSSCRIRAADFPGLRVGDWVIDARSWRPNYRTRQRGGSTLAQITAIRAADPAWLDVTLVDAGPAEQPVQPPTLGALSVDDDGVVSVPVTAVPANAEAAVYYAVSATAPATDSSLWTFLGRTAAPATLMTPPLPAGVTVWVRARGEALGRRPSPYTAALSIAIPATPRVQGVRVDVVHSVATVAWTPNAQTLGVRVFYAAHAPDVEPTLIDSLDIAAAGGSVVLPIRIAIGQSVTVEVEPWTGWTGSAVSGTAGSRVRAAATYDPERRDPRATIRRVSSTRSTETLEYQGRPGPLGRGPLEYRRRIDDMGAEGPWGPGAGDGWASLPTSPFPQQTIQRAKFWTRTVVLEVRDADLQVAEARHTISPELPVIDEETGTVRPDVALADGSGIFRKPSPGAPDTADAIPDGTARRVTTIDEAEGGGRAFQGLLQDGTVAPSKVVATSIQDGAVSERKIADAVATLIGGVPIGGVWPDEITPNQNGSGSPNDGEVDFGGAGVFTHPNGTQYSVPADAQCITSMEGVGAGFVGVLYVMFVGSDRSRFTMGAGDLDSFKYFVATRLRNGVWEYDNNSSFNVFTPNENDCIVARIERSSSSSPGIERLYRYARHSIKTEEIGSGVITRQKISAGAISDEHFSGSPADKLATAKYRLPPIVELEVLSSTDYQITFRITARDADGGQVRIWRRVVNTPSESYTTPTPSGGGAFQPQPLTMNVTVDRDPVDTLFEAWSEDEDGNRSAIARRTIPRIVAPENALTNVNAALLSLGSTCPSALVDRVTWTRDPDVPAHWRVEVWVIEGTTTGDPFSGTRLSSGATSPFDTTRLTNVQTGAVSTYNRRYGVRLLNSGGSVIHKETPLGLSDTYEVCPE